MQDYRAGPSLLALKNLIMCFKSSLKYLNNYGVRSLLQFAR
jgi:hypothetical protein